MDYKARIQELAEQIGARVEYWTGYPIGESFSEPDLEPHRGQPHKIHLKGTGRVVVPEFDGRQDRRIYWVALHELGHLANDHLGENYILDVEGKPGWAVTENEAEAWLWGIDHHDGEIDPDGEWAIDYGMSTYAAKFGAPGPLAQKLADKIGVVITD